MQRKTDFVTVMECRVISPCKNKFDLSVCVAFRAVAGSSTLNIRNAKKYAFSVGCFVLGGKKVFFPTDVRICTSLNQITNKGGGRTF